MQGVFAMIGFRMTINCSIGVMAFNEEQNIGDLLDSLIKQKLQKVKIDEIIAIISGSTDKTGAIARKFVKKDKRVKVLLQKKRLGKVSAVNLFVKKSKNKILVLASADIIPTPSCVEELVLPLAGKNVGMTGVRPVPANSKSNLMGFAAHFIWRLHHFLNLQRPKMGEMVAFKKIFSRIPPLSSVDEANIEPLIYGQGYSVVYVPEAIVYNRGPETVRDFLLRSRRIYAGHLALKREVGYQVSSLSYEMIIGSLLMFFHELITNKENKSPKYFFFIPLVILLEAYGRILGFYDYKILKKREPVWEIACSAKKTLE